MAPILSYNPVTRCVEATNSGHGPQTMLGWGRKAVIKTLTLKGVRKVQDLPIPTRLKLMLGTLSLRDFLIEADRISPDSHDTQIFQATCLLTDGQVNLRLVGSRDDINHDDPRFLAVFEEENQTIVVEELTQTLTELIEECKNNGTALDEELIWRILEKLAQHLTDNNIAPTSRLSCDCILLLPGKEIFININPGVDGNTPAMPQGSNVVYEAPEVLNPKNPDSKALVWSVGCILYEMLALKPAYCQQEGGNIFQVLVKVTNGELPIIPSTGHEAQRALLKKCLVADPQTRISLQTLELFLAMRNK